MIAIITSTVFPKNLYNSNNSKPFSESERLMQTKETIASLKTKGFENIYLIDNSGIAYEEELKKIFCDINVIVSNQFQFENRGITEILMLLNFLETVDFNESESILKITGRYCLKDDFDKGVINHYDYAFKVFDFNKKNGTVSTRAYLVKNRNEYINLLKLALTEMYRYSFRVVGFRSAIEFLKNLISPTSILEPTHSIEMSFAKVIKYHRLNANKLDRIGVEGYIGGNRTFISE